MSADDDFAKVLKTPEMQRQLKEFAALLLSIWPDYDFDKTELGKLARRRDALKGTEEAAPRS